MANPIFYNFDINNNSATSASADQTDAPNLPILDKTRDYDVSLLKFSLPLAELPTFNINNETDYVVKYGVNIAHDDPVAFETYSAQQSLYSNSTFPMYSRAAFVENFNRISTLCYRDFLQSLDDDFNNVVVVTDTETWDHAYDAQNTHNITIPVSAGGNDQKLGYVKLDLDFTMSTYTDTPASKHPIDVYLISPHGESCQVFSQLNYVDGVTLTFEDASINSASDLGYNEEITANRTFHPLESFIKYNNNEIQTGNWTLRIVNRAHSEHQFHGDVAYTLTCYFIAVNETNTGVEMYFPRIAPVLHIDPATNKLGLTIDENAVSNNFFISFSPRLHYILGFDAKLMSSDGFYRVKLPQLEFNTARSDYTTIYQDVSTVYRLIDIREIQINTDMPVISEKDAVSQSRILMSLDFPINGDMDELQYFASDQEIRRYGLIADTPLTQLQLQLFAVYNNGTRAAVQLPPYSRFRALLKFIPK